MLPRHEWTKEVCQDSGFNILALVFHRATPVFTPQRLSKQGLSKHRDDRSASSASTGIFDKQNLDFEETLFPKWTRKCLLFVYVSLRSINFGETDSGQPLPCIWK